MKTLFSKTIILSFFLLLLGCSKDSPTTPTPCPQGYTGTNCSTQITPSKIFISKIRVDDFPNLNPSGNNWDIGSSADIFVRFGLGDGTSSTITLFTSNYYTDAISNGTNYYDFIPTTPIELDLASSECALILGDYDSASSYDFMGELVFYPYNSINGFPTTISISNPSIPFKAELTLSYVW